MKRQHGTRPFGFFSNSNVMPLMSKRCHWSPALPSAFPTFAFFKGGKFNFVIIFGLRLLAPVGSCCLAAVTQATICTAEPQRAAKKGFGLPRCRGAASPIN